jgi:hypothetical protein
MGDRADQELAELADRIFVVRGKRVMLDSDLARLYDVSTKRLNEQVKRNRKRFPPDFIIELTNQEVMRLRSQFATLKLGRGEHRKHLPLGFTEHGAIMAATVLNSPRAVLMSVYVVRAFVKMRESLLVNAVLARDVAALKSRVDTLDAETQKQFAQVFEAILGLTGPATGRH